MLQPHEAVATPPVLRISSALISLMSPEEIKARSVGEVTNLTATAKGIAHPDGLMSTLSGPTDRNTRCSTCKNTALLCGGHPMHMELAVPVYHIGFLGILVKLLRCLCHTCSELILPQTDARLTDGRYAELQPKERLSYLANLAKLKKACPHCEAPHPDVGLGSDAANLLTRDYADDATFLDDQEAALAAAPLTPTLTRTILGHASDATLQFMGFDPQHSHPKHMVLSVLPVLPLPARPPMAASEGSKVKSQDDLTVRYQGILKANLALKQALADQHEDVVARCTGELQRLVGTFVHHEPRGMAKGGAAGGHASHRHLQTIYDKLRGKHGHVRENVQGKRTEHAARTVVTGASRMDIDCVGIPHEIAMKLTITERVNKHNANVLQQRVDAGPDVLHGARSVTKRDDGVRVDLKLLAEHKHRDTSGFLLQSGDVVERPMQNGDLVVINRQPTLHKMSAMCHRVQVTRSRTIELPVADTTPYNADFDGDELNIHFPRTPAKAELEGLMLVTRQIISPQSNKPIIALVQDSLVGVYLLTERNTFFQKDAAMQLYMQLTYPTKPFPPPSVFKPVALWTGKDIMSCTLPASTFLDEVVRDGTQAALGKTPEGAMDPGERRVIIQDGFLLTGSLCKRTMGTSANGIIQVVFNDAGHEAAGHLISDVQRLTAEYLQTRGFSIGIGDCILKPGGKAALEGTVSRALGRVARVQTLGGAGKPAVEDCVTKITQSILTHAGANVQAHIYDDNGFRRTVESGSKGTYVNLTQMMGCVGQQSVEGRRITPGAITRRTFPSFAPGDQSPAARGLVVHSYYEGLTAVEFVAHAAGGREGLVDTAVKTANTGYTQRKIMAMMMNLGVKYDGTVRNAGGELVQLIYGGDGYAAETLEKRSIPILTMSDADVQTWVLHGTSVLSRPGKLATQCVNALTKCRDELRAAWLKPGAELPTMICAPFDPVRVLKRAAAVSTDVHFSGDAELVDSVATTLNRMCVEITKSLKGKNPSLATRCFLRCGITPAALKRHGVRGPSGLAAAEAEILKKVHAALVNPGEMVGPLGGQSIGEPTTQLTLNSFHSAGIGSMNATLGVPRLRALIEASKNTAGMTFLTTRLLKPWAERESMCELVAAGLEHVTLARLKLASGVELEPDVWASAHPEDRLMLKNVQALTDPAVNMAGWSKHVIRISLDRAALMSRFLTPAHVADALVHALGGSSQAFVVRSERTMLDWTLLLRLKDVADLLPGDSEHLSAAQHLELERVVMQEVHDTALGTVAVQGVPGVRRSIVHKEREAAVQPDGSILTKERYSVLSQGSNLAGVMELKGVDARTTTCNDIHEIAAVLGIDAAARVLFDEISAVLSFGGTFVNPRHLRLLVDLMTHSGELTALTRHGMSRLGGSTLARACFEETLDVLMKGALYADKDELGGVTEALLVGKPPPVGTGMVHALPAPGYNPQPEAEKGKGRILHAYQKPLAEQVDGAEEIATGRKRVKAWHKPWEPTADVLPVPMQLVAPAAEVKVVEASTAQRLMRIKPRSMAAADPHPDSSGWEFRPSSPCEEKREEWKFAPLSPQNDHD